MMFNIALTGDVEDDFVMVDKEDNCQYLTAISQFIDDLSDELREISLQIHDHPELQYKEHHAHDCLTGYLATKKGWKVTPAAYGISTAFIAVFDSGENGPVVSFNAEYDALKGIGHACGHNLIAIASLGGALATALTISEYHLGGKVVLFGTPAEEGGGGKIRLLDAGAYKDNAVDISLISHPGIEPNSALMRTAAYSSFKVEFYGREAHAAARPWDGINALDALITAYNSISVLRQQTQPGDIIQGHVTNGGSRPNIIHAYASGMFVVRSSSRARLEALKKRVLRCFDGAAVATGATLKVTLKGAYDDHMPNKVLGSRFRDAFNRLNSTSLGGEIPVADVDSITGTTMASTDQGNVSYAMPSISVCENGLSLKVASGVDSALQPNFWIRSEKNNGDQLGGPHTPDFEKAARTEEAHAIALRVGKALAATAVDIVTRPDLLQQVQKEFQDMKCR